ncbi:MAG TPA: sialidase family protein [Gaiellaceae bacterium]
MGKRSLQALVAAIAISSIAIAGAASPSGRARGISYSSLSPIQKKLVSGALQMGLGPATPVKGSAPSIHAATTAACGTQQSGGDEPDEADDACPPASFAPAPGPGGGPGGGGQNYFASGSNGCEENQGDNVKVNQECENVSDPDLAGRGQAQNEESIAADPNNPNHVVASQNDYRRGDGNCYAGYSLSGGNSWSDSTVPMSFTRGTDFGGFAREYWQAGGDTSVAWDTKGNAYISCQMFNRGSSVSPNPDQSSAFYVFRSTQNDGASWNFPARPTTEFNDTAGSGAVLEDKALMAIDDTVGSPYQDRIYVTWTEFAADGSAYIYETHSSDYGETFSPRVLVSKDSPLCTFTYGAGTPNGNCNENTFSDPFTGPDGALYVAWSNFNDSGANLGNTSANNYQVLLAKSTDGGQTFSAPIKVSDYYDLPDCATYQGSDLGRSCVPEKGPTSDSVFRATNYAAGGVNPKNANQVAITFGSYINQHSNESNGCTPTGFSPFGEPLYTGVKTPGACNNDILVSVSNDGGATFTGTTTDPRTETTVNQDPGQSNSDQWFQWAAFTKDGKLAVDYYDRQYGKPTGSPSVPGDEWTGWSDMTLSGSKDLVKFGSERVTSSSMPPPTQFPDANGGGQFFGDYIWLDTAGNNALPIWSDTRDPELFLCPGTGTPTTPPSTCEGTYPNGLVANDENSYMAREGVPTK